MKYMHGEPIWPVESDIPVAHTNYDPLLYIAIACVIALIWAIWRANTPYKNK